MATKRQSGKGDLDRRAILMLGLAGASALGLGKANSVLAAEEKGIERKVINEAESMIPGFGKIRVRDTIFQPGASLPERTMKNHMICELTQGTLEVTQNGKTWTAKKGDFWTCKEGGTEGDVNKGETVAIMRAIDLLPA